MNETLSVIARRYSCRAFNGQMPTAEQLHAIAQAAIASPSGVNRQAWRVIVVTDRALMDDMEHEAMGIMAAMEDKAMYNRIMDRGGALFYHAPCMIVVPIDPKDYAGAVMDCGILSQTVALAATSLGVDNVICGLAGLAFAGDRAEEFTQRLGFPAGFQFGISILLGFADQKGAPHAPDPSKVHYVG